MRFTIGGDVSVKEECADLFVEGKSGELFGSVIDVFKNSDRVFVNLECALTDSDDAIKKIGPPIKSPKETAKVLKDIGVTDCGLSNNHIFDYGKRGVLDTIAELDKYGINYTGFGMNELDSRNDLIITEDGLRIAVIAVCEHEYSYALENRMGSRPYDVYDTNDDIAAAKRNADYVIVIYHGGKEHSRYPSPRLVKACHSMVKHGADVVLCQHSHCIGCYEKFMGASILYGQGNFHFVWNEFAAKQNVQRSWNNGLLAVLDIDREGIKINFLPIVVSGSGIDLAKGDEAREILGDFEERNRIFREGGWRAEWKKYCIDHANGYSIVSEDQRERMAHYLDCEAHHDVLVEIYKTYNHTNEID